MVAATDKPHVAVVYNPLKSGINQVRNVLEKLSVQAEYAPPQWYESAAEDSGAQAARNAVEQGAAAVIAVGGDGTVRGVATGLQGTGVPLAIVPRGTGNILARNLGMPLNSVEEQLAAAFSGDRRFMDVGVAELTRANGAVDTELFLVLAGMGIDARIMANTSDDLKKSIGWLAYVDAGLREAVRDQAVEIQVQVDGQSARNISVYTLMVGNCGYLPGGAHLIPGAQLDDGMLDVVALRPNRRLGIFSWLRIVRKIVWDNTILRNRHTEKPAAQTPAGRSVRYRQVQRIRLRVATPEPVQIDGDDCGLITEFSGRIDPAALLVCVRPHWRQPAPVFSRKRLGA